MPENRKVLGQINPAATTLTALYTVPSSTQTVTSSLVVCNTSSTSSTFRVSIAVAGAADALSQYIYYDVTIPGNEVFVSTTGLTLNASDVMRGYASSTNLVFSLFGVELT